MSWGITGLGNLLSPFKTNRTSTHTQGICQASLKLQKSITEASKMHVEGIGSLTFVKIKASVNEPLSFSSFILNW